MKKCNAPEKLFNKTFITLNRCVTYFKIFVTFLGHYKICKSFNFLYGAGCCYFVEFNIPFPDMHQPSPNFKWLFFYICLKLKALKNLTMYKTWNSSQIGKKLLRNEKCMNCLNIIICSINIG